MDNINPIINRIHDLVNDIEGYSPEDELFALYVLAVSCEGLVGDFLEIGSWCGRSAVVLALAAEKLGIRVHCVDLFPEKDDWYQNPDQSYSFKVVNGNKVRYACTEQTVWQEPFERTIAPLYEKYGKGIRGIFEDVIRQRGLNHVVEPFVGDSSDFVEKYTGKIRLAFIDGEHGYQALSKDIKAVDKLLVSGGWILFDDAFSGFVGVDKAINELILPSDRYTIKQNLTRKLFVARKI